MSGPNRLALSNTITSDSPLDDRMPSPAIGPLDIPTIHTEHVVSHPEVNSKSTKQKGLGDVCEWHLSCAHVLID